MACAMPIIAAAKGETQRVIREAKCGICVPMGDAGKLVLKIKELVGLSLEEQKKLGENGRRYHENYFDKTVLMNEMDKYFKTRVLCRNKKSR